MLAMIGGYGDLVDNNWARWNGAGAACKWVGGWRARGSRSRVLSVERGFCVREASGVAGEGSQEHTIQSQLALWL